MIIIWLRCVDRWGRAGTYGPRNFFSKPPCNLTVGQEATCLQSLPVCNYLHSHFRRRMRPHSFLMEQRHGPEQVRRHSLSCDFWDVQAARCVDTPEPDVWGGTGTARQTLTLLPTATLQWLVSEGESLGPVQWRKRGWGGRGRVGKSNGFGFVLFSSDDFVLSEVVAAQTSLVW